MGNQCSRKGENAISEKLYFKIFRGSTPPYPSSSSHLRRSRLGPPINLTLLRLTTDVTFTINCEMLINTRFCDLTHSLAFQILPRVPRIYFSSGGVAGNVGVKKLTRLFEPSSGVVLAIERRIISNQKWSKGWLVLRYIALGWFIIMDTFWRNK